MGQSQNTSPRKLSRNPFYELQNINFTGNKEFPGKSGGKYDYVSIAYREKNTRRGFSRDELTLQEATFCKLYGLVN